MSPIPESPPASAKPAPETAAVPAHPALEPSTEAHKKHRTTGNKVFDMLVYPVIAFGVVLIASAKALDFVKVGGGKEWFERTTHKAADVLGKLPGLKNTSHETLVDASNNYGKVLISFGVGTLLMAPIKLLEDQRTKISRWFDKILDSEPKNLTDYKEEPKQSWKSVLGGRGITFLSVFALSSIIGDKRTQAVEKAAGNFVAGAIRGVVPETPKRRLVTARQATRHYAFELFYTALCATLVYTLSRLIARKDDDKKHHAEEAAIASNAAPAPKDGAEQALSDLAADKATSQETPLAQPLRREPKTYGVRHDKPADFRAKYEERKSQPEAMLSI